MKKRDGASLLNVMVFMLFAVMITAQVFFFAKWSADSVAEEREIMMYRLSLDSLVEVGKNALKVKDTDDEIVHDARLSMSGSESEADDMQGCTSTNSATKRRCIAVIKYVQFNYIDLFGVSFINALDFVPIETGLSNAIEKIKWFTRGKISKQRLEYILKDTLTLGTYFTTTNRDTVVDKVIELVFSDQNFETYDSSSDETPEIKLNFREFYESKDIGGDQISTKAMRKKGDYYKHENLDGTRYNLEIRDLDYRFNDEFDSSSRTKWIDDYGNSNANKKVFAAMPHDDKGEYFLIRAWAELPDNYFGRKLMYQVLVRREEPADVTATAYTVTTLSFQEVWF